ncbi:Fic family protein [uncultured Campylobacter sp.]|mgnify:FL=1|uniref:Fic family protein n=1 Tax=uncultured Campylobacter sp. TaxID=218934 RepID=UPI0026122D39|nr:Fic family protein [uncultured Campylobacter sp.]
MNTNIHKSSQELDLVRHYAKAWTLLQRYDDKTLGIYTDITGENFTLGYNEAILAIDELKEALIQKGAASQIFATQKAGEFEGILKNIYQTFGGCELLPTAQEKAANLIYYIIKDHPFNDGNKRIGAFMFILFLSKSELLYKNNGEPKISNNTLAALALLIAQSDPNQKEMIVNLTTNLLSD